MKKFLIGCGIVAALGIACIVVGTWAIAQWAKSKLPDTKRIEAMQKDLEQRFGTRDEFVPASTLDPTRVEIFLTIRDSLVGRGTVVADDIENLSRISKQIDKKDRGLIERIVQGTNVARGGFGTLTHAMEYTIQRDQALLNAEMGHGEYGYLFALSYSSYLEWIPAAGDTATADQVVHSNTDGAQTLWAMRETFIRQLRNLETALVAAKARDRADEELLTLIRSEIAATTGGGRFPLAGHVPADWRTVLDRYRERITATRPKSSDELFLDRVQYRSEGFNFQIERETKSQSPGG